jgi:hypothetical protein
MTKPQTFLFAFVLALLVVFAVHFLDFRGSVPRFKKITGGGVLLDQSPSFNVEAIYERLSNYGEKGRNEYTFRNVTVDILLPISLLPFLFLLMFHAIRSLQLNRSIGLVLVSIPLVYVIFDFAENADVLVLLKNYPQRMDLMSGLLPYLTSVKRVASLLALFVPVGMFGLRFLRRWSASRRVSTQ